jgi:HEAT repeat protein
MSDTISNPNPSHWNALRKIVKRLPANLAYYGSALGAIVLAGGGQLPPGLEFVAGSIGGNMLSNMISDIIKDEDLLDDEIRQRAEEAIHKSDIANLLTKQDFLQGYARLIQRLDAQKTISQDILDELRTGFSKVATADQVEELKRLILQLMQQPPQTAARKVRLFISYARADDAPFVERLYHDLKDEFDVWWDRETMSNRGKTFLQEIRDAIDWSDRLLLVTGPRAFSSPYVRDEWQHAYETYKGINIALRLGDYIDFPAQLRGFDAPDFRSDADYDERLETLKRQLAEPVAPIGAFHNVPALPPHFLNRPDALDTLRELVIADVDKPTLISAEKRTTAVEGMGGIGKSALATAFAHDRKVRFAFPDGIMWLTAGRSANLYELYRTIGIALGDDQGNYRDEASARQNAQKALAGKKCLLILDDVWELPVGRAFRDLISGTVTRLLITTRNLQINDLLNANEYRLKLIDKSQAADYLRSWAADDPKLDEIAEKLGYLFLALKLAGARMRKDNLSGADYLRTFDRVSRMKIDRNTIDRDDSLEVSITLSVDAAFAGIENKKLLYHALGNFREDASIPQQTILELWQHLYPDIDEFDLSEILTALVDLALVERNTEDRTITLHDLVLRYAREKLDTPLSVQQLAHHFQDNPSLLKAIQETASLHAVLRTPLILQIFILVYRNAPISELQTLQTLSHPSDIRDHIVKAYIERQYQIKAQQRHSWTFRLQDVLETLGRAAMLNVVGGSYRLNHKGGELSDYELNPKLFSGKFDDFIGLAKDLQLLIHAGFDKKGIERFQFPHLILRDYLAYTFSLPRLRDVGWNQDRGSHIPSPAMCIGRLKDHRAVEQLIAVLKDKTANVRMNAAYGLGALKDTRALQPLIESLKDAEWNVRSAAVWALGRIENRDAVQPILDALNNDESWDVRKSAVGALAELSNLQAVPQLISVLKNDKDFRIRQAAAHALGDLRDVTAVEPLIEALESDIDSVTPSIADALGCLRDARAIEPLIGAAGSPSVQLSNSAQQALGKIGISAISLLTAALKSDDYHISQGAAMALRYFQEAGLRILIDALTDDHPNAMHNAVFALSVQSVSGEVLMEVYGYQSRPTGIILRNLLRDEPQLIHKIIHVLLRHSDTTIWQNTGKLLVAIGEIAVQPIIDSIGDIADEDIYKGLEILSQTTNANLETLTSFETDVRFAALVLGVLVRISQPAVKPLLNIITTSETRSAIKMLAMGALIAIGQIAEPSIVDALQRINDNSFRWDLMLLLEQIATEVSIPILVSLLDVDYHPEAEDQSIGDIAASILQKIGTKEALAALEN